MNHRKIKLSVTFTSPTRTTTTKTTNKISFTRSSSCSHSNHQPSSLRTMSVDQTQLQNHLYNLQNNNNNPNNIPNNIPHHSINTNNGKIYPTARMPIVQGKKHRLLDRSKSHEGKLKLTRSQQSVDEFHHPNLNVNLEIDSNNNERSTQKFEKETSPPPATQCIFPLVGKKKKDSSRKIKLIEKKMLSAAVSDGNTRALAKSKSTIFRGVKLDR